MDRTVTELPTLEPSARVLAERHATAQTIAGVLARALLELIAAGLAKRWDGYAFGRGGVELTDDGKKAI